MPYLNETLALLKIIGSPFHSKMNENLPESKQETLKLYRLAWKNRIPLLYLMSLREHQNLYDLEPVYKKLLAKSLETHEAMARVSNILEKGHVNYAFFKTVRPYLEKTVDLDILVFNSKVDYEHTVNLLLNKKYQWLGSGPNSVTLYDTYSKIGIDLYRDVAVSHVIYMDIEKLRLLTIEKKLSCGNASVRTLSPLADLLALISHSIIKEHLYTLSEYFSTLCFLSQMNDRDLEDFISLVQNNYLEIAAGVHLGITAKLCELAFLQLPMSLRKLTNAIGMDLFERKRISKSLSTPHKFHAATVWRAIWERFIGEEKTRDSVARQVFSMLKPEFAKNVATMAIDHVFRETY